MDFKKLKSVIKKHKWWVEEFPATPFQPEHIFHCFIEQQNLYNAKFPSIIISCYKDGACYEISSADEKHKTFLLVVNRIKKDRNFLNKLIALTEKRRKTLWRIINKFDKSMTNTKLAFHIKEFMDSYVEYLEFPVMLECGDVYTTFYLHDDIKKSMEVSSAEVQDIIEAMTSPKDLSFMEQERKAFLEIAGKKPLKEDDFAAHAKKYYFMLNNYKTTRILDKKYFYSLAKDIDIDIEKELDSLNSKVARLKQKKKEIESKYIIPPELRLKLDVIETMGECIDQRKHTMLNMTHFINFYYKEISRRTNINTGTLQYYSLEEALEALKSGKKIDEKILESRKKGYAVVETKGFRKDHFYAKDLDYIFEHCLPKKKDIIKGAVASAPVKKIKGRVQVIFDTSKQDFKKGNILVATMTRPEFLPIMRKASAIITDEGGITCHAAIVSRELKIPCIIGTRIATKVLKDGDLVEMDTEKGIIKRIK